MPQTPILDGIKVLDFTHVVAGPHCTRLMAEHGAEVIKIEPLTGDPIRTLPFHKDGRSGCFVQHNIGKKNMALDINTPEAKVSPVLSDENYFIIFLFIFTFLL